MLIPLDPKKNPSYWENFEENLLSTKNAFVILNSSKIDSSFKVNIKIIQDLIKRMKGADYVRLGSNRGVLIPMHFSLKFLNAHIATVCDLILLSNSDEEIKNNLLFLSDLAFLENPNLKELIVPIQIDFLENETNYSVVYGAGEMTITKISAC